MTVDNSMFFEMLIYRGLLVYTPIQVNITTKDRFYCSLAIKVRKERSYTSP
jgi:hypothetical protein